MLRMGLTFDKEECNPGQLKVIWSGPDLTEYEGGDRVQAETANIGEPNKGLKTARGRTSSFMVLMPLADFNPESPTLNGNGRFNDFM